MASANIPHPYNPALTAPAETVENVIRTDQNSKRLRWSLRLLADGFSRLPDPGLLEDAIRSALDTGTYSEADKAYRIVQVLREAEVQEIRELLSSVGPHRSKGAKAKLEALARKVEDADPRKLFIPAPSSPVSDTKILPRVCGVLLDKYPERMRSKGLWFFEDQDMLSASNVGMMINWCRNSDPEALLDMSEDHIQALIDLYEADQYIRSAFSIGFPTATVYRSVKRYLSPDRLVPTPENRIITKLPEALLWKRQTNVQMQLFQNRVTLQHPYGDCYEAKGFIIDQRTGLLIEVNLILNISNRDPDMQALFISTGNGMGGWIPAGSLTERGYSKYASIGGITVTTDSIYSTYAGIMNVPNRQTDITNKRSKPWVIKDLASLQPHPIDAVLASRSSIGRWY